MTYVARFSNNIEADIKRGWSGYFATNWQSFEEAINDTNSDLLDEDLLEEKQRQWVNTWGDEYEDYEIFIEEYIEEIAEELSIVFDEQAKIYRPFHHYGLSCWALNSANENDAIIEATARNDIQWGGFGQQTIGDIEIVKQVSETLWILKCEDTENEE